MRACLLQLVEKADRTELHEGQPRTVLRGTETTPRRTTYRFHAEPPGHRPQTSYWQKPLRRIGGTVTPEQLDAGPPPPGSRPRPGDNRKRCGLCATATLSGRGRRKNAASRPVFDARASQLMVHTTLIADSRSGGRRPPRFYGCCLAAARAAEGPEKSCTRPSACLGVLRTRPRCGAPPYGRWRAHRAARGISTSHSSSSPAVFS